MTKKNQITIVKDLQNKKLLITRNFEAPLEHVWKAWTERELLDQWWAPKPWKAETKKMEFKVGGYWLYAMVGPDQSKHWSKSDYTSIVLHKSFEGFDYFCDENGNKNVDLPSMNWKNEFHLTETGTKVIVEVTFAKESDIKTIIEMGFEAGFTSALENLDHYFEEQFKLRNQMKTSSAARTSTYLNFPGTT